MKNVIKYFSLQVERRAYARRAEMSLSRLILTSDCRCDERRLTLPFVLECSCLLLIAHREKDAERENLETNFRLTIEKSSHHKFIWMCKWHREKKGTFTPVMRPIWRGFGIFHSLKLICLLLNRLINTVILCTGAKIYEEFNTFWLKTMDGNVSFSVWLSLQPRNGTTKDSICWKHIKSLSAFLVFLFSSKVTGRMRFNECQ